MPYLIIFVTGYWTQLTIYWVLGTFSNEMNHAARAGGVFRAFETAGQAVSYGLSSASNISPEISLYVNCALLALVIPSMILLIARIPKGTSSENFTNQARVMLDDAPKAG